VGLGVLVVGGLAAIAVVFFGGRATSTGSSSTAGVKRLSGPVSLPGAGQGPTTVTAAPRTAPGPGPVTISLVGDTDLGDTPMLPPDAATYLDPVRGALAAPIVFGNLEGTLTDTGSSKCGAASTQCYAFRAPPSYAYYLRAAGFTVLNSANNHAHDFGAEGVADTSAALSVAGVTQAGLLGQVPVVRVGSTTVAFVDFAPYTNTNNLLDFATAKTLIQQARSRADIVVVYMHAGAEGSGADHVTGQEETYVGEDRGNPEVFAHAAIDDGADLVVASGPHVLRGMELYRGHLVAYSLGNFAGYHNFATSGDLALSGILKVTLDGRGRLVSGTFTSLTLNSDGRPGVDPSGAAGRFVAQLSAEDFGTRAALSTAGTIVPPTGDG
jgi:hypothetical protein